MRLEAIHQVTALGWIMSQEDTSRCDSWHAIEGAFSRAWCAHLCMHVGLQMIAKEGLLAQSDDYLPKTQERRLYGSSWIELNTRRALLGGNLSWKI